MRLSRGVSRARRRADLEIDHIVDQRGGVIDAPVGAVDPRAGVEADRLFLVHGVFTRTAEFHQHGHRAGLAIHGQLPSGYRSGFAGLAHGGGGELRWGGFGAEEVGCAAVLARTQQVVAQPVAGHRDAGDGHGDVELGRLDIGGIERHRALDLAEQAEIIVEAEMADLPTYERMRSVE